MKERFSVRHSYFSIMLIFALTLSLIAMIGPVAGTAVAQTPGARAQTYAPVWGSPQDIANRRAWCKALFKDMARYQAMPPSQLPKLSPLQAQELHRQQDDCMRLFPPAGPEPSATGTQTLRPSRLSTPTPVPTRDDSSLMNR
jgi:hypothetical protein